MIKKILVPVDGSEHASKAIEFVSNMAKQSDATVHFLHVVQVTEIPEAIKEFIREVVAQCNMNRKRRCSNESKDSLL